MMLLKLNSPQEVESWCCCEIKALVFLEAMFTSFAMNFQGLAGNQVDQVL